MSHKSGDKKKKLTLIWSFTAENNLSVIEATETFSLVGLDPQGREFQEKIFPKKYKYNFPVNFESFGYKIRLHIYDLSNVNNLRQKESDITGC